MNFSTFGPFPFGEFSKDGLKKFWLQVNQELERLGYSTGIEKAIGVYIVTSIRKNGALLPCYVGKTDNSFGIRFSQHRKRFASLFPESSGKVGVFLIARVTGTGKYKKVTDKMRESKGLKSIDRLEFALIGECLKRNQNLINLRERTFHKSLHVPGFANSARKKWDDAARQLAGMLRVRN